MFKDKNLLVLTPCYPDLEWKTTGDPFVKAQIDEMKDNFNKIYIISPIAFFPIFFKKIPFLKKFIWMNDNFKDYKYENIEVYYPRFFHLPIEYYRKKQDMVQFKVINKLITTKSITFDLIHAHFIRPCWGIWSLLKEKYIKPLIITWHWFDVYDLPFRNNYWKSKIKGILRKANLIITVSEKNKEILQKICKGKKIITIPNWYDENNFFIYNNKEQLKEKFKIDKDKIVILTIWNLIEIKNQISIILACNELKKDIENIIFFIIGSGNLKEYLQSKINNLWLESYIKLLWKKKHNEIPEWINIADIFILPSYNEGNPTVMFEALGCGIPYIGTKVWWVGEVILSEDIWFIYDNPKNYKELSNLIIKATKKTWDREKIASYSTRYTWQSISKGLIKIYTKFL